MPNSGPVINLLQIRGESFGETQSLSIIQAFYKDVCLRTRYIKCGFIGFIGFDGLLEAIFIADGENDILN